MRDKWDVLYGHICYLEESNNKSYQKAKKDDDVYKILQFEAQHRIYLGVKDYMDELIERYS